MAEDQFSIGQYVRPKCRNSPLYHPKAKIRIEEIRACINGTTWLSVTGFYATGEIIPFDLKATSVKPA